MKQLNNKGFSALHVLLVVVVIGLISGVGYYVYKTQQHNKEVDAKYNALVEKAKSDQDSKDKKEATTNTTPASDSAEQTDTDYFVVKEWGIRIKTDASESLYYKTDQNSGTVVIYSKSADGLKGSGGKSCEGEYIAYLARYKVGDQKQNDPMNTGASTKIKDVDGYTYWVTTHKDYQPECFMTKNTTTDESVSNSFDSIAQRFKTDSSTIEKVQ